MSTYTAYKGSIYKALYMFRTGGVGSKVQPIGNRMKGTGTVSGVFFLITRLALVDKIRQVRFSFWLFVVLFDIVWFCIFIELGNECRFVILEFKSFTFLILFWFNIRRFAFRFELTISLAHFVIILLSASGVVGSIPAPNLGVFIFYYKNKCIYIS